MKVHGIAKAAAVVVCAAATANDRADAAGVPVIDATAIAQFVQSYQTQLQELQHAVDQLETMRQELITAQEQLASITGARQISQIMNSANDIRRRAAATSLEDIQQAALNGTPLTGLDGFNQTINGLRTRFDLASLQTVLQSGEPIDEAIAEQATAGMAAIVTAEDTYQRANGAMDRITTMIGQIDGNGDLKASIDFNTRVMSELAVLLNENLRIQAANANVAGASALAHARDSAAKRQFMVVGDGN